MNKVADSARYPIELFFSEEDDGYIAIARDLPGCSAFGKSQVDAINEIQHAIQAWQQAADAAHNPIPEPSQHIEEPLPSGRLLLRIPRSLHAALIECAKKEAASLNQHLVSVLSFSVSTNILRETHKLSVAVQSYILPVGVGLVDIASAAYKKIHIAEPAGKATIPAGEALDLRSLPPAFR
jgi:predicted RNase H-like HicB family nuclease